MAEWGEAGGNTGETEHRGARGGSQEHKKEPTTRTPPVFPLEALLLLLLMWLLVWRPLWLLLRDVSVGSRCGSS